MTERYVNRRFRPYLAFWLRFIVETLGSQRVAPLVAIRLGRDEVSVTGLEHLPADNAFVLAVNHYSGRPSLNVAAAVLYAASQTRPDAVDAVLFVVGSRERSKKASPIIRLLRWIYARWSGHAIRITLGNEASSVKGLREWRTRRQPMFVFPEGRASVCLGRMRRGSGRWLSILDLPVIPVGVWWEHDRGWQVCFGKPIQWTHRPHLRDLQLGLTMASLLPPDLAPDWQRDLERWRAVHQERGEKLKAESFE